MASTPSVPPAPTRIYRWWDADGILLYVGITVDPMARAAAHVSESDWTQWAVRMEVEPIAPGSRAEAEQMERDRIVAEYPIFNRAGAQGWWVRTEAYLRARGVVVPEDVVLRAAMDEEMRRKASEREAARAAVDEVRAERERDAVPACPSAIHELRSAAETHRWTGRSAVRDRIVLNVLIDMAQEAGCLTVVATARAIARLTPYGDHNAASRALRSLSVRGWLTSDRRAQAATWPSMYRLAVPQCGARPSGRAVVTPSADPGKRRLAMVTSPHGQAVHAALWEIPQSRNQVAARAGVSRPTAGKWLWELALLGLCRASPAGWVIGDTDPDVVAFEQGADLKEMDRADRHAAQRRRWGEHRIGRDEAVARVLASRSAALGGPAVSYTAGPRSGGQ